MQSLFFDYFANCDNFLLVFRLLRNGRAGRYIRANKSAVRGLGYTEKELLKLRPYDLDAKGQSESLDDLILRALSGFHSLRRRTIVDKSGHEADVLLSLTVVRAEKKCYVFQEITYLSSFEDFFSDNQKRILELEKDLKGVRILKGTLDVCADCGNVKTRNDKWVRFDSFLMSNTSARFSHGFCPPCLEKLRAKLQAARTRGERRPQGPVQ